MPIRTRCPVCGHGVVAPDGSAGRRGRCPKCNVMIRLPTAEELAARTAQGQIPPEGEDELKPPPHAPGEPGEEDA